MTLQINVQLDYWFEAPCDVLLQVEAAAIKARAAQLRAAVAHERAAWLSRLVGQPQQVLAERDGTGHAENFARVRLAPDITAGTIVTVIPDRITEGLLA